MTVRQLYIYVTTKHIELDCHFVRDEIIAGTIATFHVSSKSQLADVFTKALGHYEFEGFKIKLGIRDLYPPTWGGGC